MTSPTTSEKLSLMYIYIHIVEFCKIVQIFMEAPKAPDKLYRIYAKAAVPKCLRFNCRQLRGSSVLVARPVLMLVVDSV